MYAQIDNLPCDVYEVLPGNGAEDMGGYLFITECSNRHIAALFLRHLNDVPTDFIPMYIPVPYMEERPGFEDRFSAFVRRVARINGDASWIVKELESRITYHIVDGPSPAALQKLLTVAKGL